MIYKGARKRKAGAHKRETGRACARVLRIGAPGLALMRAQLSQNDLQGRA